jgi:hypothetical protein
MLCRDYIREASGESNTKTLYFQLGTARRAPTLFACANAAYAYMAMQNNGRTAVRLYNSYSFVVVEFASIFSR